jgi:hypothetical protein
MRLPRILGRAPRNADFGELQLTFLVSAVTMILVIRTQLWLTNYPQLGGGGLHVAHLLWGGLFMALAIGILITFLGRPTLRAAAILGGVGFGFFIDELGKFITEDNNYFYEPAAALIYLIFVAMFLLMRAMRRGPGLTRSERLSNAIELVGEAARRRFDERDRRRALAMLARADPDDPLVEPVRRLVAEIDALPPRPPSRLERWVEAGRDRYEEVTERRWFQGTLDIVFALWAAGSALAVLEVVLSVGGAEIGGAARGFRSDAIEDLDFLNVASLGSSAVSAGFVFAGLRRLHTGDRLAAYDRFERAVLVSIFVTRVFAFVESQFAAVFGLGIDLLLLATVNLLRAQERRLRLRAAPR